MEKNEVLIDPAEKERLVDLLKEAQSILQKYPYRDGGNLWNITVMSRAKVFVADSLEWCELLYTTEGLQ